MLLSPETTNILIFIEFGRLQKIAYHLLHLKHYLHAKFHQNRTISLRDIAGLSSKWSILVCVNRKCFIKILILIFFKISPHHPLFHLKHYLHAKFQKNRTISLRDIAG